MLMSANGIGFASAKGSALKSRADPDVLQRVHRLLSPETA